MLVYLIVICIPLIWCILSENKKINNDVGIAVSLAILFFISSFRNDGMGDDYQRYIEKYRYIAEFGDAYFREKGYVVFNKLLALLSTHYLCLGIGVNLLLFIPLYFFIKDNIEERYWSLAVLIFVANPYMYVQSSFNLLRQCCATGLLLISVNFIKKKSITSFIIGILFLVISMEFHRSVVILALVIIPCLMDIKWPTKALRLMFLLSFGLNLMGIDNLIKIATKIAHYDGTVEAYGDSLLNNIAYIALCFIYCYWLTDIYDNMPDSGKNNLFVKLYLMTMIILPIALMNDLFYRARIYFQFISLPGLVRFLTYKRDAYVSRTKIKLKFGNTRLFEGEVVALMYILYAISLFVAYFTYLGIIGEKKYVPYMFWLN